MNDADPGIRLAVGVSGSGKTYGITRQLYRAAETIPIVVIDRLREWRSMPPQLKGKAALVSSMDDARRLFERGGTLAILTARDDYERHASEAFRWACEHTIPGRRPADSPAGVAIPEAHSIFPNGDRLTGWADEVACRWRHHGVALWLDTQRISLINRTLTEQARELRVYAVSGSLDLRALKEYGGKELAEAATQCARRLRDGERGWHVKIRITPIPPYELERET